MSDNNETQVETTPESMPSEYSMADAVRDLELSNPPTPADTPETDSKEISEDSQEDAEATENEVDGDDSDSIDESLDADAEQDDEEDESIPELDADAISKLPPAEQEKRWRQIWKGIRSKERKLADKEQQYAAVEDRVTGLLGWMNGFDSPSTAIQQFKSLASQLKSVHGLTDDQLFGYQATATRSTDESEDYEQAGFSYESDYQVYERAKADAKREIEESLRPYLAEIDSLRKMRAEQEEKAQFEQFVAKASAKAIKVIAAEDNGWRVTPQMVSEAIRQLPQFKDNPAKAVRMLYSDERAAHKAAVAAQASTRGPELLPATQSRGYQLKSPDEYTIADAMSDLGL